MTDRNYPPSSRGLYEEIEEEVKKVITKNYESSLTDVELIQADLKCLEGAFHQYTEQIKEALTRIETRNRLEKK